jgi:hypothetical protein
MVGITSGLVAAAASPGLCSGGDGEGGAEALEGPNGVGGSPALQRDESGVPQVLKSSGDGRVIDLPGARFGLPGHVRHLDLPDQREGPAEKFDQVSFADLGVR